MFIRTAVSGDLEATAALQIVDLPMGLFPSLGRGFVARWHRTFLDSAHAVALVGVRRHEGDLDEVLGFLVGTTDRGAFRREVLTRHRFGLVLRGVTALVVRPRVLAGFLRTRLLPYMRRLGSPDVSTHSGDAGRPGTVGDLTAIAVSVSARRGGTGRRLAEIYLARCAAAGADRVELVTTAESTGAHEFYSKTGWTALEVGRTRDGLRVQRFGRHPGSPEGVT
ncbi:acetyltransferase (GNAT) family protein [Pseudonocardia sediminis]|uniref:Acetyltransferase (GNAT) family protein n=1 Tax=Pseudonocardia sediminis TaxID=1397368 RepID=A0A4Q7UUK8_PSEST|nr:GNAT family N-acetyltransferase [Pseudonocardia sediminis]RZT85637.1 acetyltransferase (GNAT) family protein [Pseudonocardia sediminis]